jgi:Ser-tRNA(Ala) deacylase AlaX
MAILVPRPLVKTLYQDYPDLEVHPAHVTLVGQSEYRGKNYHWIQLDETIFHPHGGGQLSDKGTIDGIPVPYVHKEKMSSDWNDFEVRHCFDESQVFQVGG